MSVSKITGGGTGFPQPIKSQEVHSVEAGAARKPHHVPSTQLPSKEAAEAALAAQLRELGIAHKIDLEA